MTGNDSLNGIIAMECPEHIQNTLDKKESAQLIDVLSKDILAIAKELQASSLIMAGCAYSVEEILQPTFPLHSSLTRYASSALQGSEQQQQLLSIGADAGKMPAGLTTKHEAHTLMLIPFVLKGISEQTATRLEQQLMHKGMVSPPTYSLLCALFNSPLTHVNYMTTLDLIAMMHNHYQQMNQEALWRVIEHVLLNPSQTNVFQTNTHNFFYTLGKTIFTPFFSHQQLNNQFKDSDYAQWLLQQRIAISTFQTHGLQVRNFNPTDWRSDAEKICLGSIEKTVITGDFLSEFTAEIQTNKAILAYRYFDSQLGLVAFSVENHKNSGKAYYYPINEQGISAIESYLNNHFKDLSFGENRDIKQL